MNGKKNNCLFKLRTTQIKTASLFLTLLFLFPLFYLSTEYAAGAPPKSPDREARLVYEAELETDGFEIINHYMYGNILAVISSNNTDTLIYLMKRQGEGEWLKEDFITLPEINSSVDIIITDLCIIVSTEKRVSIYQHNGSRITGMEYPLNSSVKLKAAYSAYPFVYLILQDYYRDNYTFSIIKFSIVSKEKVSQYDAPGFITSTVLSGPFLHILTENNESATTFITYDVIENRHEEYVFNYSLYLVNQLYGRKILMENSSHLFIQNINTSGLPDPDTPEVMEKKEALATAKHSAKNIYYLSDNVLFSMSTEDLEKTVIIKNTGLNLNENISLHTANPANSQMFVLISNNTAHFFNRGIFAGMVNITGFEFAGTVDYEFIFISNNSIRAYKIFTVYHLEAVNFYILTGFAVTAVGMIYALYVSMYEKKQNIITKKPVPEQSKILSLEKTPIPVEGTAGKDKIDCRVCGTTLRIKLPRRPLKIQCPNCTNIYELK